MGLTLLENERLSIMNRAVNTTRTKGWTDFLNCMPHTLWKLWRYETIISIEVAKGMMTAFCFRTPANTGLFSSSDRNSAEKKRTADRVSATPRVSLYEATRLLRIRENAFFSKVSAINPGSIRVIPRQEITVETLINARARA